MAAQQKAKGASLEIQKGWYRIVFRYSGQKFQRALNTQNRDEAEGLRSRILENLKLVKSGRLDYQIGDDLISVLLSDGKLNAAPKASKPGSFGGLLKEYRRNINVGKEENTRYTERIHIKHLLRVLGRRTPLNEIQDRLQEYIKKRAGQVSQVTIKKELGTLSSIWNKWALREKVVLVPLTLRNLDYPKKAEKGRFQTWAEIDRRITRSKLKKKEQDKLWEFLYLDTEQIKELVTYVRETGCLIRGKRRHFPWVHPMVAFCAYTGARRSEMLRSELQDLDFEGEITIREKKKDHEKEFTFRHVPMLPQLKVILQEWLEAHPGGQFSFCKTAGEPLSVQMASHYLRWSLEGGKWNVIKGFHTLRHSFISNLASKGISERVIMSLAGHLNRETSARYSHLFPSTVEDAMSLVFGDG
ncbi:MAG TPA: tyrosine-type recombinase/integrase [Gemmataceae bacterium]|nr:tyrosine-type recombinase/integrase [Gemmataceae bacterium]